MGREWIEITCRIFLALCIGALIGWERKKSQRPAGMRTHMLVCVGAALCMIIGYYGIHQFQGQGSVDPTRIGAQVISGIGFLGAGTILRDGFSVRGLTTAASIWTVACIGLAVGSGCYFAAIVAAVMVFVVLTLVERLERKVSRYEKLRAFFTIESMNAVKTLAGLHRVLRQEKMRTSEMKITERISSEGEKVCYVTFQLEPDNIRKNGVHWDQILKELQTVEGITGVEMEEF